MQVSKTKLQKKIFLKAFQLSCINKEDTEATGAATTAH